MRVGWKWLIPLSLANIAVIAAGVLVIKYLKG
jgi:NADH:ubiquinone oxidoreductase subunit H